MMMTMRQRSRLVIFYKKNQQEETSGGVYMLACLREKKFTRETRTQERFTDEFDVDKKSTR